MAGDSARPAAARKGTKRRKRSRRLLVLLALSLLLGVVAAWFVLGLRGAADRAAQTLALDPATAPVDVLAAPRLLRIGEPFDLAAVQRELDSLGYRRVAAVPRDPGEFRARGSVLEVYRRRYPGPLGAVDAAFISVRAENGQVARLAGPRGESVRTVTLEPVRLGAFRGERLQDRKPLPLEKFPARFVAAVLSAEDPRFLDHHGLDWRGMVRAARDNLTGGDKLQGASTITQQVLKNRVVGTQRTMSRKLEEVALAPLVESRVGKERLLTIYLNEVYLGQQGAVSVVGFPAASLFYFGKDLVDLDLSEMAMLAGLIASPGRFDPRRHAEAALQRRNWVLGRMVKTGAITSSEGEAARKRKLETAPARGTSDASGDLLDAVHRELVDRGWEPRPGIQPASVHTTIDAELQHQARLALDRTLVELERDDPTRAPLQGAVVVLVPTTGEILAMVGGREGVRGGFHRALDGHRQPGSAFKPFVALAAMQTRGMNPATQLEDAALSVPTTKGNWTPENFDHQYRGPVTLRRALEESLNVPMVRVALETGAEEIVRTAHQAGIESSLPPTYSLALGTGEVTPRELAVAYATLASLGIRREPSLIRSVDAREDDVPVSLQSQPLEDRVFDPADCYLVLDMLTGVVERGTGRALQGALHGQRVAAKTGSTQDGRDAWFVMASSSAVVVVWVGRDDGKPARLTGASAALPVVRRLVESTGGRLLGVLPEAPEGIVPVELCAQTGMRAGSKCPEQVTEMCREGQEPELCNVHLTFWRKLFKRR